MKIRKDFITNSSSSSFVIVGVNIKTKVDVDDLDGYDKFLDTIEEHGLRYFYEEDVIGKVIADLEDYTTVSLDMVELQSIFEDVRNTLNSLGIKEDIKLISGTFST